MLRGFGCVQPVTLSRMHVLASDGEGAVVWFMAQILNHTMNSLEAPIQFTSLNHVYRWHCHVA